MELRRLRLQNFRQHVDTDLTFGPGLTVIVGPNGSGKSTLLEGIAWAFFGLPAVRGTRDSIRWSRAPAKARVEVEVVFGLGGRVYRVLRSLNDASLWEGETTLATGSREVTEQLEHVLGLTRTEFFQTYFTGQKDLAAFQAMGPAERGRFLSRVLGYDRLRDAQDQMREARSTMKGELATLDHVLGDPQALEREAAEAEARLVETTQAVSTAATVQASHRTALQTLLVAWSRWQDRQTRAVVLERGIYEEEMEVSTARRDQERLVRELAAAAAAAVQREALASQLVDVDSLRNELAVLDRAARSATRRMELTGQRQMLDERLAELEAQIAAGPTAEAREAATRRLDEFVQTRAAVTSTWETERADARSTHQSLQVQYRELEQELTRLSSCGPEEVCPTCRRELGHEYDGVIATLTQQVSGLLERGREAARCVETLTAKPAAVVRAEQEAGAAQADLQRLVDAVRERTGWIRDAESVRVRLADVTQALGALSESYDPDRHDVVRTRLREKEPVLAEVAALSTLADQQGRLADEVRQVGETVRTNEDHLGSLRAQLKELGWDATAYADMRNQVQAAQAATHTADMTWERARAEAEAAATAVATIERRQTEWADRAARRQVVRAALATHEELDRALGDLRADLNTQLRPELADRASQLLADLTAGRYAELELTDQYEVVLLEEGEPKPVISGGEEDVAHLVLRLAIAQMVAERAGQPLALLILDEIFGSLDEDRRQHVMTLLRALGDRFGQVLLITHLEAVRDTADHVVRVTLDPQTARTVTETESLVEVV